MLNNQLSVLPAQEIQQQLIDIEAVSGNSDSSLSNLSGKRVFFRSDFSKETIPLQNLESISQSSAYQVQNFSEQPRERQVFAIDSSCALVGETDEGSIFAGRVAVVSGAGMKIRNYYRAGPFIFYMSLDSLSRELKGTLSHKALRAIVSDNSLAERYIRIKLERSAQIRVAKTNTDSLILIDGAIRRSLLEPKNLSLREFESAAEGNFNQCLGISKSSSLRVVSNAAGILQSRSVGTGFYDLSDSLKLFMPNLEGRVLVVKFCSNAPVFRVDSSKANVEEDSQVLADLRHNDIFFRGYPETLRLAHHLSVFDSSTIASTRSYLSRKYGMIRVPSDDLRATILGKLV